MYEETQARYQQWNEAQAAERQRNDVLRAIERERNARRARFDRYVTFFERARSGTQTFWSGGEPTRKTKGLAKRDRPLTTCLYPHRTERRQEW